MSVEVAVERDVGLVHEPADEALDVEDGRERLLDHRLVLPVQVPARKMKPALDTKIYRKLFNTTLPCGQRAPSVSDHHAVGVQHGDDLEDHAVAEDPNQ